MCKFKISASAPVTRASRGAAQVLSHFTVCKFWKKNASALHSSFMAGLQREPAAAPGLAGGPAQKLWFKRLFICDRSSSEGAPRMQGARAIQPQRPKAQRCGPLSALAQLSQDCTRIEQVSGSDPTSEKLTDRQATVFFPILNMLISR